MALTPAQLAQDNWLKGAERAVYGVEPSASIRDASGALHGPGDRPRTTREAVQSALNSLMRDSAANPVSLTALRAYVAANPPPK